MDYYTVLLTHNFRIKMIACPHLFISISFILLSMTTSLPSDGFTLVDLPEFLERAIFLTKKVLSHRVLNVEATEAKLFVKIDGVKYETSSIYLRKYDPEKVEQLRCELLSRFPDDEFTEILLGVRKLKKEDGKMS